MNRPHADRTLGGPAGRRQPEGGAEQALPATRLEFIWDPDRATGQSTRTLSARRHPLVRRERRRITYWRWITANTSGTWQVWIWDLARGLKVTDTDSERIGEVLGPPFWWQPRAWFGFSVRSACGQRAVSVRSGCAGLTPEFGSTAARPARKRLGRRL